MSIISEVFRLEVQESIKDNNHKVIPYASWNMKSTVIEELMYSSINQFDMYVNNPDVENSYHTLYNTIIRNLERGLNINIVYSNDSNFINALKNTHYCNITIKKLNPGLYNDFALNCSFAISDKKNFILDTIQTNVGTLYINYEKVNDMIGIFEYYKK